MSNPVEADLKDWIGRSETATDVASPDLYGRLAGLLGSRDAALARRARRRPWATG